jgi:hypothetical protein
MTINWSDKQLKAAGINKQQLQAVIQQLEDAGRKLKAMRLELYFASGSPSLWHKSRPIFVGNGEHDEGSLVADLCDLPGDGGDF